MVIFKLLTEKITIQSNAYLMGGFYVLRTDPFEGASQNAEDKYKTEILIDQIIFILGTHLFIGYYLVNKI